MAWWRVDGWVEGRCGKSKLFGALDLHDTPIVDYDLNDPKAELSNLLRHDVQPLPGLARIKI